MKNSYSFLWGLFFLVSCTSNTIYKKPKNLIPKDTMVSLLTDMYLASSAKHTKNKMLEKEVNYMILVYEKYGIDSLRFEVSNTYYTSKLEEYNDMLKEVKQRIKVQNTAFDKEIRKKDSIKRVKNKVKLDTMVEKVPLELEELELKELKELQN